VTQSGVQLTNSAGDGWRVARANKQSPREGVDGIDVLLD
jgi:hypothetical protein